MIKELLANKIAKERANIKASEVAKLNHKGKFLRGDLEIEITDLKAIEGGVEVFARAWKNGKQLGFGKDGSVDIERFRIYNPPILVPDDVGDVFISEIDKITGKNRVYKYREDPTEAILQVLGHNLVAMKNVHLVGSIVSGKIGNTTSTFFPSADDSVYQNPAVTTWATIRGAATGDAARKPGVAIFPGFIRTPSSSGWNTMERGLFVFDTSTLPDTDDISSATFSLYGAGSLYDSLAGATKEIALVASTPASNTAIVADDYDQVGTTKLATNIAFASWNLTAYNNFTLNADGLAAISKTGFTKLGTRHENDRANVEPTIPGTDALSGPDAKNSAEAGTTQDPKLVVEHTASTFIPRIMMS